MKNAFVLFGLICTLCFSCSEDRSRTMIGNKAIYGDTVHLSIPEPIEALHPLFNTDLYSHRIICNIFEPLFELDTKSGKVLPRVAERYEWKKENTVLRIYLKKGVLFHDDACFENKENELTAQDVKFTLELACSRNNINQTNDALIGKIKGADVFFKEKKAKSIAGITVINPYCIEIELNGKYTHFPKLLTSSTYGICSKKAFAFYNSKIIYHPIGTGPFKLNNKNTKEIILVYHPQYWKNDVLGNALPYLDGIVFHVIPKERNEVIAFKNQQLDLISEVSPQYIDQIITSLSQVHIKKPFAHKVLVIPGSTVSLLVLNQKLPCFNDARVRKAFDLIIDREVIANDILNGDGIPAMKGFAPFSPYYNNHEIPIKQVDEKRAKQLFNEAGYGNKPFPVLDFYIAGNNTEQAVLYCKNIASRLKKTLGVKCNIHLVDLATRYKAVEQNKAAIWKLGWAPDYPDPEAYFSLFYSKNQHNNTSLFPKINSAIYDFNYIMGMEEADIKLRNNYFTSCDQIIQEENWILPILYEDFVFVYNMRMRGVKVSQIGTVDFTNTFIRPL